MVALRITFISENQRSSSRTFETDDPSEAIASFVKNWHELPALLWAFALVIEQEESEERMGYSGFSDWLRQLLGLEAARRRSTDA